MVKKIISGQTYDTVILIPQPACVIAQVTVETSIKGCIKPQRAHFLLGIRRRVGRY